jgi:hypothetical protein
MLQQFKASPEIVLLRELEKWSYARRDFWTFRQCIHPDLILGDFPQQISRRLQKFYRKLAAGQRPKLVISSPPRARADESSPTTYQHTAKTEILLTQLCVGISGGMMLR